MSNSVEDWEQRAAGDPLSHPQLLSDIASRRPDLHRTIAANPAAFPELLNWIASVNPGVPMPTAYPAYRGVPKRRSGAGWWFAGCGCLALVAMFVLMMVFGGAVLSVGAGSGSTANFGQSDDDAYIDEQLAIAAAERDRYYELAAQLDGNPIAPLVLELSKSQRLDARIAEGPASKFHAEGFAEDATAMRESLEQRIADAETRRGNASGTISEAIVDEAGNGFIDIAWDAAAQCGPAKTEGRKTAGCTSGDPFTVHILPEGELFGEMGVRTTTLHELAHLYVQAEVERFSTLEDSTLFTLKDQGYFEGSGEKLADCYALTYTNTWTLSYDQGTIGYGYVCNETERQAIRDWAHEIGAPMP